MKKDELSVRLARQAGLSKPVAADRLDRMVHDILKNLRKGQAVSLPGLGTFVPGEKPVFRFEPGPLRKGPRDRK